MSNNTQNLTYVFGANISQFQQAISNVQQGLRNTGQQLKNFGSDLSTYVSLPLAAMGAASLKAFGDIQALKMGLTSVMGSATAASSELVKLKEVAKLPGLGLKEAAQGSVNLQAAGFSADEARRSLVAFGNALATVGKGKRELDLVTLALTQLNNKSSGFGQDLRQLTEQLPQLRGALLKAFGTMDTEAISKMGYTGRDVVAKLTTEFEKLPKVTGGINNAFENMGDTVFNSLASVGEMIDKTFDISSILGKVSDAVAGAVTWFQSLSPEIQKVSLIFGGLAIVIPPILVGLGVLVGTILPALIGGFAALVSPVGIAVAAIVAAAALIITNWDSVKEYFTNGEGSKFWNVIKTYASDLWESLKSIFLDIHDYAVQIWQQFGDNITGIVLTSFNILKDIITSVLGTISGIFQVFAGVVNGNWSQVWEGVKGITASVWNGITNLVKNAVKSLANVLGGFFKLLGMDSIGNGLTNLGSGIDSLFANILVPIDAATNAVKDFKKELTGVKSDGTITGGTTTTTTPSTGASKADKKTQEAIAQTYKDLAIGLKQVDALFGASFDEKSKKKIQEYQTAINALIKNGVDPASTAILNLHKLQQDQMILQAPEQGKAAKPNLVQFQATPLAKFHSNLTEEQAQILLSQIKFNRDFNNLIENSMGSGIGDAFAAIGEAFGSGGNALESFGQSILKSFSGFLGSFGDLLIRYGTAAVLKGKLDIAALIPGAGIAAGLAAIGAGVALKVAQGAFSGLLGSSGKNSKKDNSGKHYFANGGIVTSPTNAVFGEYPSAGRGNPEIVTPLNNLKGMLSDINTGGMNGEVSFRIQGDTLVGVLNNYNKKQFRTN